MSTSPRLRLIFSLIILAIGVAGWGGTLFAQIPPRQVIILTVDGAIDVISQRYISRGVRKAEEEGAELVIIQLDTPGGLLSSTAKIVEVLLNARVPIAVYVRPAGAFAASAGTFVTAAANFAVMSEGSSIGAAAPVGPGGEDLPATLSAKAKSITIAMVEGIAEKRGRNKEKLISTVTEAQAFSAREAVAQGIADFIAADIDDLLAGLDGRSTKTAQGTVTLNTASLHKRPLTMSLPERFISFIANPNVVTILLTVGGLGIFAELLSPGLVVPGVVGVMSLVLAFVALGVLPFNWAGVALLGLAAVLIFFEIQVPGLGFLGAAAVVAFVLGALLLFSVDLPSLPGAPFRKISLWLLAILSGAIAAFTLLMVTAAVRSRRLEYPSPATILVGQTGHATSDLDPTGTVQVSSELWSAESQDEDVIRAGEQVKVVAVEGLTLKVRRA